MAAAGGSRSTGGRAGRGGRGDGAGSPDRTTSAEAPVPAACASCGSPSLTRLPMVLADGTDVVFVSCHACETKSWLGVDADGVLSPIPIDSVLARSARKR